MSIDQALAACARFMGQWGPEDEEEDGPVEEPYDPYECGDED